MSSEALSAAQFQPIKAEGVREVEMQGGVRAYEGTVAAGQVGYRGVRGSELWGRGGIAGRGAWSSSGSYTAVGLERKHHEDMTMFAMPGAEHELAEGRHGYTHVVEADLSGLPFRTLRKPQGDEIHADIGLGLGVIGPMHPDRIRRVTRIHGEADSTGYLQRKLEGVERWGS